MPEQKKKVLVVDDAEEVRQLIQAMLESHGYDVITAVNGLDGLEKVRAEHPAVVLADVLMPEMDGLEFFKHMKADDATSHVPIIILTARAKMQDSFLSIGADSFLAKPIDAEQLFHEVQKHINRESSHPDSMLEEMKVAQATTKRAPAGSPRPPIETLSEGETHKVMLFGRDQETMLNISRQLEKEHCVVMVTLDENQIVRAVDAIEPQLILLQITGSSLVPIDQVVMELTDLIRRKSERFDRDLYNPNIVLYRVDEKPDGLNSMPEQLADTETLLERCNDSGSVKYIGLYSSISFLMKIKVFLNG